ncbi:MAG: hypothetical protein JWQ69_5379 [Pseudomonas sp.]|nr:hypothetical protein [Pseudomonas sp.]
MFEPGHLHITRAALQPDDVVYDIDIRYEVRQDAKQGASMHFSMDGEINGKAFKDEFELPKDMAYNFASEAFHIAVKHGMPKSADLRTLHDQYDAMFEDIRQQLDVKSGDPVKPEHLE